MNLFILEYIQQQKKAMKEPNLKRLNKPWVYLSTLIEEHPNLDPNTLDLIELLEASEEEIQKIRADYAEYDFDSEDFWLFDMSGFWELRDALLERFLFKPTEKEFEAFFNKIHNNEFSYKIEADPNPVQVVSLYYRMYSWNSFFVFADPHYYYNNDDKFERMQLKIKFSYRHIENQLIKLLEYIKIDPSEIVDAYPGLWEIEKEDFYDDFYLGLTQKYWNKTKEENDSKLLGFIAEGTGGQTFDLDTNTNIDELDIPIQDHIKQRGLDIQPKL